MARRDAEVAASRSFEFHWFRGEHEWQKDALVKALHLPWGDDYAQQGHAYTSGCVHAEPSRTVLDLVQSADDELLGQQYATVHVRRGDTRLTSSVRFERGASLPLDAEPRALV